MKKEKVLVTGANGMLGSNICRELIKQNYNVKAFCLPTDKINTIADLPIEIAYGDILNKKDILDEMKGCDYVIHAAAMTNVWPRRNAAIINVNVKGTQHVMEAAEELSLKRMIHIGSASSFCHGSGNNLSDETKKYSGWKYGMDYLDSKYMAQEMLLEYHRKNGFPVVIINPTFMIGPFDSGPSSGQMLISYYKGNLPGFSNGGKNFVCTVDVATAVVNSLKIGKLGQCYIAGNENLSFREFFKKTASALNKPFTINKIPFLLILCVGAANSIVARLVDTKPKVSYGMAKLSGIKQYFNSEKAIRELKMPQTSIEMGIKQAMVWFQNNGYL